MAGKRGAGTSSPGKKPGAGSRKREPSERFERIEPPDPDVAQRAAALAEQSPVPARADHVLIGTASWTDASLVQLGNFYPQGATSAEERLRFYASQFTMVEVDASYYALPSAANALRWVERTPPGFVFDVKAYAALTEHPFEVERLPKDLQTLVPESAMVKGRAAPKKLPSEILGEIWRRFCVALEPLHEAGKLGAVLLQYPPWFTATRGNVKVIERARAYLGDLPASVEFRHASWGVPERFPRVLDLLREHRFSFVVVDEPQGLPNSMPPTVAVADPGLSIVRFHGHRRQSWNASVSVHQKFGYLYDPSELTPWVDKVRQLSASAAQVHLVFNNCFSNYAVVGAKDMAALLAGAAESAPSGT